MFQVVLVYTSARSNMKPDRETAGVTREMFDSPEQGKSVMKQRRSLFFLPVLILWSLVYGSLGGVFFKLLAVIELWHSANRMQLQQWKRYPARHYQQFTAAIVMAELNGQTWSLLPMMHNDVTDRFPRAPFPFLIILCNTLIALLYLPYALCSGLFRGPAYVFAQGWSRLRVSPDGSR